jgi:23S rRNA (adenine2503-C2)-methyltransferase
MQTTLVDIAAMCKDLPEPVGRKYCLNFAYATGNIVDGEYLATLFDPKKWMCKITPIHNNNACRSNDIKTVDGYSSYLPYKEPEDSLKKAGFDVLVFIPSQDEEDGIITCGNAILGGSTLKTQPGC